MSADGMTKGSVDRSAIVAVMSGSNKQAHPFRAWRPSAPSSAPSPSFFACLGPAETVLVEAGANSYSLAEVGLWTDKTVQVESVKMPPTVQQWKSYKQEMQELSVSRGQGPPQACDPEGTARLPPYESALHYIWSVIEPVQAEVQMGEQQLKRHALGLFYLKPE